MDGLYEESGSGPAVVLLHAGFGGHPLSPESSAPEGWVLQLLGELQVPSAVVVGCSYGGGVALRLAIRARDRVDGLVLVSAPAPDLEPSNQMLEAWDAEESALEMGNLDAAVAGVLDAWLVDGAPDQIRDLVAVMQRRAFELQSSVEVDEAIDPLEQNPDLLGTIDVPALVAVGDRDMPDFLWSARTLSDRLPKASCHVIQGAGHLAPLEAPDGFRVLLADFLAALG